MWRDCRGIEITEGALVCYGYRSGNTGGLSFGVVRKVTPKGVRCQWGADDPNAPTGHVGGTIKCTGRLCVVSGFPVRQRATPRFT